MTKVFGGSPLAVLGWLILLSLLVGVALPVLGLVSHSTVNIVSDAFIWLWHDFLLGAAVVIPVWLLIRLLKVSTVFKETVQSTSDPTFRSPLQQYSAPHSAPLGSSSSFPC